MRILIFDPAEFESRSSEEHFIFATAAVDENLSLQDFVEWCDLELDSSGDSLTKFPQPPLPLDDYSCEWLETHLTRFTNERLPANWRDHAVQLSVEWNDIDMVTELSGRRYRLYWYTTA